MGSSMHFGAPGDSWVYDPDKKIYDLTRGTCNGASPSLVTETTRGRPDTSIMISQALTALVVVDMQIFFLHPDCSDYPDGLEAAKRIVCVVKRCRELGIRIIWLNWGLTEQDLLTMPPTVLRSFSSHLIDLNTDGKTLDEKAMTRIGLGSDLKFNRGKMLMTGSWNVELYETLSAVSDQEADIFCTKDRMSGLWRDGTPLHEAIAGKAAGGHGDGFRTLLFAGVNTDQCVLGTITDAYNRGFDCIMLEDCCATKTPGAQEVTAWNVSRSYGFVTNSERFCDSTECP